MNKESAEPSLKGAASASITVVHSSDLSPETAQTPGSLRQEAISSRLNGRPGLWAGTFLVQPGAGTGIHHHGEQETIVYVLEGESLVRWGEHGEHSAMVHAGDFLHVPGWLAHQETNCSRDRPFRWVVVRSTPEPIIVNLPADYWDKTTR